MYCSICVVVSYARSVVPSDCYASPTLIAMFYYTLGNLSPKYRSLLKAIQLACVAPVSVVNKYGVDAVLAPVVQQLKKLEQVISCTLSHHFVINKYLLRVASIFVIVCMALCITFV